MKLVLALALGLSVALNVWLFTRASQLEAPPAPPAPAACTEKLQACERAAALPRGLGALELRAAASTFSGGLAAPGGAPPVAPGKVISEPTPELERELLAQLVREKVQQEWLSQEQAILEGLRKSLPDLQK